jgi:transglutaminase-like putative cysteine protease
LRAERWDTDAQHHGYIDLCSNRCERVTIAAGASRLVYEAEVLLSAPGDRIAPGTPETPIMALLDEHIAFVMPSRFCLPDELGHDAWQRFGDLAPGWERGRAIVDFVHGQLEWVAGASNPWTTAVDAYRAGRGVCRDFAHLAITFCRALNIPARYVCGYIPDIDVPSRRADGLRRLVRGLPRRRVAHLDARNNRRRVGRVVVGRGRDAADVALLTSFGPVTLTTFEVRAA